MKVFVLLILGLCLLGLLVLPGFWLVRAFNLKVKSSLKLPMKRYVFICLTLCFGLLGLMGIEFEGAALSWVLTLGGLNLALCVLLIPVYLGVRKIAGFLGEKFKNHRG